MPASLKCPPRRGRRAALVYGSNKSLGSHPSTSASLHSLPTVIGDIPRSDTQ